MNEQKKILFYEEGFFEKSIHDYDPILSSYLDEEKKGSRIKLKCFLRKTLFQGLS